MANLLDQASIVLTPTAYDDGKVLCAKPSEPPYGDFDFSRNSAATRVNAQGLVENVQILSSNLVQNGDFSEEGVQEVSNGSFSQEGVQLLTNGDFSNGSTDWILDSGWSVSDNKALCDGTNLAYITQTAVLTTGKSYKVRFDIVDYTSGSVKYRDNGFVSGQSFSGVGSYTDYVVAGGGQFRLMSENFIGSIDNVSVREVGQDWSLFTGWSIAEDKAVCSGSGRINPTNNSWLSGKTYKFDIEVSDRTAGYFRIQNPAVSIYYVNNINSNGTYTYYINTIDANGFVIEAVGFIGSITNISVKEVLQDWSVEDYGAVSASAVITPNTEGVKLEKTVSADWRSSFLVQPISYTSGSQYKVTFRLKNGNLPSGGSVYVRRAYDSSSQSIVNNLALTNDWVEYTYYFVADSNSEDISFGEVNWQNAGVGQYFYIDDVSVIEITDDTNLPRINYEGFSYQDALGSELITNGGFEDGLTDWTAYAGTISIETNIVHSGTQSAKVDGVGIQQSRSYTDGEQVYYNFWVYSTIGTSVFIQTINENVTIPLNQWVQVSGIGTINGNNSSFRIRIAGGLWYIDNISVKEYLGQEVVPDSGCGSWLFEPQSTNLFLKSEPTSAEGLSIGVSYESFDWGIGFNNCVRYPNNSTLYVHYGGTCLASTSYTLSYYIKMDNGEQPIYGTDFTHRIGNTLGTSPILTNMGNGVYRVSETKISSTSNLTRNGVIKDTNFSVNGFRITALQLEQQSYATSYIPTSGSTVTRNQDVCTNGGSLASINSAEGTLYAEIAALVEVDNARRFITLNDGTSSNAVVLRYEETGVIHARYQIGGVAQCSMSFATTITDTHKVAFKYAENDFSLWIDGVEVGVDGVGNVLATNTINNIDFDSGNGNFPFYGKTKALAVWKEALSDEELTELTTI